MVIIIYILLAHIFFKTFIKTIKTLQNSQCLLRRNKRDGILGGIQQLVSTYSNRNGGGDSGKGQIWTQERKLVLKLGGGGVLEKVSFGLRKENYSFEIWGGGVFWKVKTQSAKICLILNFFWGGGGAVLESQNPSTKICLNFNLGGGCSGKSKPKVPRSA